MKISENNFKRMPKSIEKTWKTISKLARGNAELITPVWTIADKADLSKRSVQDAIRMLANLGVLKWSIRKVKDRSTGRLKNDANRYVILLDFTLKNLASTRCKFAELKRSFKRVFKDLKDLKQEEVSATPAPAPTPTSSAKNTYQKPHTPSKRPSFPTTVNEVKAALGDLIDRFEPAVVQHVIMIYGKLLPTGHIGNPLAWIKGALRKEQARYSKFGYTGIKKRAMAMTFTNFLKAGGFEEAQQAETFWADLIDDRQVIASQWI